MSDRDELLNALSLLYSYADSRNCVGFLLRRKIMRALDGKASDDQVRATLGRLYDATEDDFQGSVATALEGRVLGVLG